MYQTLGYIALLAAAGMYVIGGNNPNLTELRDLFFVPLPLAFIFLAIGKKKASGQG